MVEAIYSPAELAQIQAYHAPHYFFGYITELIGLGLSLFTLRFVVRPLWSGASKVAAWLSRARPGTPAATGPGKLALAVWGGPGLGAALLFGVGYIAFEMLVGLPQDVYLGYIHEHRYGMSNYTPGQYALDVGKDFAGSVIVLSCLTFGMFGLARKLKHWWLVLGAVVAVPLLFSAALDPYRARIYFDQAPMPASPLREKITALMAKAHVEFSDLLVQNDSRASVRVQAYFAGRGPTRTIVLNDQLLKLMKEDEVLAVVAHEAGHVHESRWPGHIASSVTLLAFLFLVDRLLKLVHRKGWFGVTEIADIRALPLILIVFWTLYTFALPVTGLFSRQRELAADRYGVELTGDPEAFKRMLTVACKVNKCDPAPPRWMVIKGRSHPPTGDRIKAVEALATTEVPSTR